jgi:hypothetical protein
MQRSVTAQPIPSVTLPWGTCWWIANSTIGFTSARNSVEGWRSAPRSNHQRLCLLRAASTQRLHRRPRWTSSDRPRLFCETALGPASGVSVEGVEGRKGPVGCWRSGRWRGTPAGMAAEATASGTTIGGGPVVAGRGEPVAQERKAAQRDQPKCPVYDQPAVAETPTYALDWGGENHDLRPSRCVGEPQLTTTTIVTEFLGGAPST